MKKIILTTLSLAITIISFAQINKGQFLIGGSVSFESTKSDYQDNRTYVYNNFFLSPALGYFFIDKLAAGVRVDFRSYNYKNYGSLVVHQNNTSLSPFARYYFLPATQKVNVFVDGSYIHNKNKFRNLSSPDFTEKANGYAVAAGPAIFLTKQVALEFTVGYRHSKTVNYPAAIENKFSTGFGLQIHFGNNKKNGTK